MAGEIITQADGVTAVCFSDDGSIPNSRLPALIYAGVVDALEASPEAMESLFEAHLWPPAWRASVFTYHHYHSTAHEALGVAAGSARLMLGGPKGEVFDISAGDVLVIPAGVGHKRLTSTEDFLVVGGYPQGQSWDLLKGDRSERPRADENIDRVPLPGTDPAKGAGGPLLELWGAR